MKKKEVFLAQDSEQETLEKLEATMHDFFDFLPDMEEMNEEFWYLLYWCLTNEDNCGNHRQTDTTMFLWRQTMILLASLNQYYLLHKDAIRERAQARRRETDSDS